MCAWPLLPCRLHLLQALAVMFVWVAVGGVMTAVERLDVAGSRLIGSDGIEQPGGRTSSTASPGSAVFSGDRGLGRSSLLFSRRPSKLGLQASHLQQQHSQHDEQQQQQRQQNVNTRRPMTSQPPLPRHNTHLQQPSTAATAAAAAEAQHWRQAVWQLVSALLLLPVLHNIAGFWAAQCRKLLACFKRSQRPAQADTQHGWVGCCTWALLTALGDSCSTGHATALPAPELLVPHHPL